jgi:hypothetical protein
LANQSPTTESPSEDGGNASLPPSFPLEEEMMIGGQRSTSTTPKSIPNNNGEQSEMEEVGTSLEEKQNGNK